MKPINRGGTYYAKWRCVQGYCFAHPQGNVQHYISLRSTNKKEAQARIDELDKKLDQQKYRNALGLPPTTVGSDLLLGEFAERYLKATEGTKAFSTWQGEEWHLRSLMRVLGDKIKLAALTPNVLASYRQTRLQQIAPLTWNSHVSTLQAVFEWGVRQGWLTANPMRALEKVKHARPTKDRYVSEAQLGEVLEQAEEPLWKAVLSFLFMTYCRGGELRNLKPEHVHRDQGFLEFVRPKEKRRKVLPLTPALLSVIDLAMSLNPGGEYVFMEEGRSLTKERLYRMVRKLGERAGVKLGPHRFRHSGVTDALAAGIPLAGVQAVAGHSQLSTTQGYLSLPVSAAVGAIRPLPTRPLVHTHRRGLMD